MLVGWFAFTAGVGAADVRIKDLRLVPTFASLGVEATIEGELDGWEPQLRFRRADLESWRGALPPVIYGPDSQVRGSVLELEPDHEYAVQLALVRGGVVLAQAEGKARTWTERRPIARDVELLPEQAGEPLVIRAQGTPDGWIRYRARAGVVLDVGTRAPQAVLLDHAAFVIVEGLTIRGGAAHAVHVVDSHDVVVGGCDIAGWGDPGTWRFHEKKHQYAYLDPAGEVIDRQAGIRVHGGGSCRVVLERNLIHHPRGTAGCWAFEHPHGPSGIVLSETGGNNVVRFNDLVSGDGHRWNDAIESEYNSAVNGGPYRDTDLYGNLLVGANDDGTELDGGQLNVRYWHNRIEGGLCGVSCAPDLRGPSYVFRNVIVLGDERGAVGAGFKMGGDRFPNPGYAFLLNNTVYTTNYGLTAGHYGKGPTPIYSRNNIFAGPLPGHGRVRFDAAVAGDLDHDLIPVGGLLGTPEPRMGREGRALVGYPVFQAAAARDFRLSPKSVGAGAGEVLPNLSGPAPVDFGAADASPAARAWPIREAAPTLLPGRLVVRVHEGSFGELMVHVTADDSWQPVAGEAWLSLAPAAGARGGADLHGRIDATHLAIGTHRTFVAIRTGSGWCRAVPVDVEVEPAAPVRVVFAPATQAASPSFQVEGRHGAPGGGWVRVLAAKGKPLSFDFEVPADGDYFVLAQARASGPVARINDQDSVDVAFDAAPPVTWDLFGLGVEEWIWSVARPKAAVDGRFRLAAGHHQLHVIARERDLQINQIVVANSPYP